MTAAEVCDSFGLGKPRVELTPVRGGLLQLSWRLVTTSGSYFVKDLSGGDPTANLEHAFASSGPRSRRVSRLRARPCGPSPASPTAPSGPAA